MSHILTYEIRHARIKYTSTIIPLTIESITHLEYLFRIYLSDYLFTRGINQ